MTWNLGSHAPVATTWGGDNNAPASYNVTMPYISNFSYTPISFGFSSINGQSNNSVVQEQNRTFVWADISGATHYNLIISNNSTFTDIFLNLSNISEGSDLESMPGGDYSEAGGYVTFLLPYAYNITYYGYHYYKVRAYVS